MGLFEILAIVCGALVILLAVLLLLAFIKVSTLQKSLSDISTVKNEALSKLEELNKSLEELKKENSAQKEKIAELQKALNADSFDGRLPICSNCKDIRDEKGVWHQIEEYISSLSTGDFSHSLCPTCAQELYPGMFEDGKKLHTLTWK